MIKIIIVSIIVSILLSYATWFVLLRGVDGSEDIENYTGGTNRHGEFYQEKCLNGIVYYNQGVFGLAVAVKPSGLFYQCARKNRNG